MSWARLDDNMPHHPKIMAAGLDAFGFDAAGLCYCNRYGTDGFIADSALSAVFPPAKAPKKLAQRLVEVGRWTRDDERGGYVINDFLEYNLSAEEVRERREEIHRVRVEAGRKGGIKSGEARKQRSKPEANASSKGEAVAFEATKQNGSPDPTASPRPLKQDPSFEDPRTPTALVARLVGACSKNGKHVQQMAEQIVQHGLTRLDPSEVERLIAWAEDKNPEIPAFIWESLRARVIEIGGVPLPEDFRDAA